MLLRRLSKHVTDQNWPAVIIDFLIVVFGVYIGVWISGYQDRKSTLQKQQLVIESLRQDMVLIGTLDVQFRDEIDTRFDAWQQAYDANQKPPPIYFRIPGSDTPPQHIWNSLQQNQLANLFSPDLLNDLGLYYSELEGVSRKYIRYIEFVEIEVLPGLKEDRDYFYRADGLRLKSKYEANMDRLREWRDENARLSQWSGCLAERLKAPMSESQNCTPNLSVSAFE